jgi:hypothetical protein
VIFSPIYEGKNNFYFASYKFLEKYMWLRLIRDCI